MTVFLPFFGEFGPFIGWYVRMVHQHVAVEKTVYCQPGQEFLFPSATEFRHDWKNPVSDDRRCGGGEVIQSRAERDEIGRIVAAHPGAQIVSARHPSWRLVSVKFPIQIPRGLPSVDVVIAPRRRGWEARRNYAHWPAVAQMLRERGLRVGIAGAEDTSAEMPADARAWEHPAGPTAGSADLLAGCRLYIGGDSGISHLAAFLDVPSLIIPNAGAGCLEEMKSATRGPLRVLAKDARASAAVVVAAARDHLAPLAPLKQGEIIERIAARLPMGKSMEFKAGTGAVLITRQADGSLVTGPYTAPPPPPPAPDLFTFFDRVECISLAARADRRCDLEQHLHEIAWPFRPVEFVVATPGRELTPPRYWTRRRATWANLQSHLDCVRRAYADGLENVLILEDDVLFMPGFRERVAKFCQRVPAWDCLMLGGTPGRGYWKRPEGDGIFRVGGMYNIEAYAVARAFMPRLIELWSHTAMHSDEVLAEIMGDARTFHALPPLAQQRAGWSNNFEVEKPGGRSGRVQTGGGRECAMILSVGAKRRLLVANAAASLRRNMLPLDIEVWSDAPLKGCRSRAVDGGFGGIRSRAVKTELMQHCRAPLGLVLDDDTITMRPFPSIAEVLGDADIAMAPDHGYPRMKAALDLHLKYGWGTAAESDYTRAAFPDCEAHAHFNSGVIFFRRGALTAELSRVWREEWERFRGIDQIALYRALRRTGLPVKHLPPELHYRAGMARAVANPAIIHVIGGKWQLAAWLAARGLPVIQHRIGEWTKPPKPARATYVSNAGGTFLVTDAGLRPVGGSSAPPTGCTGCAAPAQRESEAIFPDPTPDDLAVYRALWAELHARPAMCDLATESAWVAGDFAARIPCATCRAHWLELLASTPPALSSNNDYAEWTIAVHNAVNSKLGKPVFNPSA